MKTLLMGVLGVVAWVSPASAFLIDDFSTGTQSIALATGDGFSHVTASGAIGGHRSLYLNVYTPFPGNQASMNVSDGSFSHNNDFGVYSWGQIRYGYDELGANAPLDLDLSGNDEFRLSFAGIDQGVNLVITAYSSGGNSYANYGVNLGPSGTPFAVDAPFAAFLPFTAGGGFHDLDYLHIQFQAASGGFTGSDFGLTKIEALPTPLPSTLSLFGFGVALVVSYWVSRSRKEWAQLL
jgi:hypothetical protein